MSRCANSNCGYYWKEVGEEYPRCHFPDDDPWPAPCEYEDEGDDDEDDDDYDDYDEEGED